MTSKIILKSKIFSMFISIPIILASVSPSEVHAIKDDISKQETATFSSLKKNYEFRDLSNLKIETERLTITPTTEEDLDTLSEYLLDKDVSRYLENGAELEFATKEEALEFLKSKGSDEIIDAAEFTLKLKGSDQPIGKLDLMLNENSVLSIGYWLGKEFQNKGYMSEACYKICDIAFNASDVETLYIACTPENISSFKLADKIFEHIKGSDGTPFLSPMKHYTESATVDAKEVSFDYCAGAICKTKN